MRSCYQREGGETKHFVYQWQDFSSFILFVSNKNRLEEVHIVYCTMHNYRLYAFCNMNYDIGLIEY